MTHFAVHLKLTQHTKSTVYVCSVTQSHLTLCGPTDCTAKVLCPWESSVQNTGVGCHALLQGIFLSQGPNLHFLLCLHWQVDSLPLCYLGIKYTPTKMFKKERKKVTGD